MKSTLPKYISELYGTTADQWAEWLAFCETAKQAFTSWDTARQWFESLTVTGGSRKYSSITGNGSDWKHAHPFPWAIATYGVQFACCSISLSYETSDSDLKDICSIVLD